MNIPKKETLTIEFKSDQKKLSDDTLIESVVALANTHGGFLYLGVEDDGTPTGLHEKHRNIITLGAFIANKTVPPVTVRMEILEVGVPILCIEVSKSHAVVATSSGRALRRRLKADETPENVPMYPYELTTRLTSLGVWDYSAQPLRDGSYDDLDPLERERLRTLILSYRGEQALLELSDEELDKALRLVVEVNDTLVPTVCGMLLLGKPASVERYLPTNATAFQVLEGSEVRVNDSFALPLLATFQRMNDHMNAWNRETEMEQGLFRTSIPDFDHRAFREALVNAFAHRDYSVLGRTRLLLDEDGLTLSSPGGFIEGVTKHNLLTVEPHGRNPALADALKRIGLAERTGRGVDRIYEGSLCYGKPLPDYSQSNETVVRLFIARGVPDKVFVRMISEQQRKQGYAIHVNALLVLNALRERRRMTVHELVEQIYLPETKLRSIIERLMEGGLIEAYGTGRGRYYVLGAKLYRENEKEVAYVRQTDIEQIRYPELVLQLARNKATIARSDVAELLHISPSQANRILKRLVENGNLIPEGERRGRVYRIATQ